MGTTGTGEQFSSSTARFLCRLLDGYDPERRYALLDMGCGTGHQAELLLQRGHEVWSYDLMRCPEALSQRMRTLLGEAWVDRFRVTYDEQRIPFDDGQFDVIYSNMVFEHVRFIEAMFAECCRTLRPGGRLIALFPFASTVVEPHCHWPGAHWLPPGGLRRAWLLLPQLVGHRRRAGLGAVASAAWWDEYLSTHTFYRAINHFEMLGDYYFESHRLMTEEWLTDIHEHLRHGRWPRRLAGLALQAVPQARLARLLTTGWCAAYVFERPRAHREDVPSVVET